MRQLVEVMVKAKGKPKTMPDTDQYNAGKTLVSILLEIDGEEQWIKVDAKTHHEWLKTVQWDKPILLVKEWSHKKKNKEGKEGAYVYRPILLPDSIKMPAKPVDQKKHTTLQRFLSWLSAPLQQKDGLTPIQVLMNSLVKDKVISTADAKKMHDRATEGIDNLLKSNN